MSKVKRPAKARVLPQKQAGHTRTPLRFQAIELTQSTHKLYFFKALASVLLWRFVDPIVRSRTKTKRYQRVLSQARVQSHLQSLY